MLTDFRAWFAANDRTKYYLALLQAARDHAAHPDFAPPSLDTEREASGVDDPSLDVVVAQSTCDEARCLLIPHATVIHTRIVDGIREMLEPFKSDPLVTWVFALEPVADGSTRLIVRARGTSGRIGNIILPLVHFIMERKQLLGIAHRAGSQSVAQRKRGPT